MNGSWTKTRAEYLDLMRRLRGPTGPFRASTREAPIMNIRFLTPDVAGGRWLYKTQTCDLVVATETS